MQVRPRAGPRGALPLRGPALPRACAPACEPGKLMHSAADAGAAVDAADGDGDVERWGPVWGGGRPTVCSCWEVGGTLRPDNEGTQPTYVPVVSVHTRLAGSTSSHAMVRASAAEAGAFCQPRRLGAAALLDGEPAPTAVHMGRQQRNGRVGLHVFATFAHHALQLSHFKSVHPGAPK